MSYFPDGSASDEKNYAPTHLSNYNLPTYLEGGHINSRTGFQKKLGMV